MSEALKNRLIFWMRMLSWLAVGCGTPIGVFAYKFGLFTKTTVTYDELGNVVSQTSTSLNGWGLVSVLLIGSFITTILKDLVDSCSGYSLTKQCYVGICKTMPLIIAFATMYFLNGVISQVMYCLGILIVCRLISIPLNPMPKWKYEKQGAEDYNTLTESLTKFVKSHLKRGEG